MQNFTNEELKILKGLYSVVGRKYRKSGRYVSFIANTKREDNTELAKSILKDLKLLVKILEPIKKK